MIAINAASKSFDGGASFALNAVSLHVSKGEFLVLVGPSGAGKTTLLKLVNRLVDPTSGTVAVDGEDVAALDPAKFRRRIGYVFQGVGLFPHLTVAENIGVTPRLLGWSEAVRNARVLEMLDLVRLPRALAPRLPATLSGGQAQRVGVARALAANPRIVLMDEPFGAIDPITRDGLARDYRALHDALGLTTVMVTHDVLEALLLADRIGVVVGGSLLETGTPRELLATPRHPYVRDLMAMPRRQSERVQALATQ